MKVTKVLYLYLLLLGVIIVAMVGLRQYIGLNLPLEPRDLEEIREEGVMRIAIEYNTTSYFVSGDSIAGLEYELCRAIERYSGLKVELYPEMNLAHSLQGLQKQQYDVVARSIPITAEVKQSFLFTEPIETNRLVLVQRNADANKGIQPIRNQLDLAGKTVYIPEESGARQRISNLAQEIADSIFFKEDPLYGEEQLIMRVADGQIDYAICDERIASRFVSVYPQIDILTAVGFNQFRGWALRKDSPVLCDSLNSWLKQEISSPRFKVLQQKYLDTPKNSRKNKR